MDDAAAAAPPFSPPSRSPFRVLVVTGFYASVLHQLPKVGPMNSPHLILPSASWPYEYLASPYNTLPFPIPALTFYLAFPYTWPYLLSFPAEELNPPVLLSSSLRSIRRTISPA